MTRILQISDTHFGTEVPSVIHALESHVQKYSADLLIVSGDITQRARPHQFAAARAFLRRLEDLGIPQILVIPGNHDIPLYNFLARFTRPYANYSNHFGNNLEPCFENDQLLVIGLNTTHPYRHKNGKITDQQIEQVIQQLRKTADHKLCIVVAHQPFGAMRLSDLSNLQQGAAKALKSWAKAGLDMVMGGHIHLPYVLPLSQQYPELDREIWMVQAGTTLSSRLRGTAPNSFNRLELTASTPKTVSVQRWDLLADQFVCGAQFNLNW